jgi:large subunit ribosomal protein L36
MAAPSTAFYGRSEEEAVMKVRSSLRSLKQRPGASVVRRHGKTYVIDKVHPRAKARQG